MYLIIFHLCVYLSIYIYIFTHLQPWFGRRIGPATMWIITHTRLGHVWKCSSCILCIIRGHTNALRCEIYMDLLIDLFIHGSWIPIYIYICNICMCLCMYVGMYVCTYARMHVCTYARMHVCMYACMHVCMYACMHVCTFHVCMYACMHVCMYACMHVCMYARMHVCMYACMHVCMYACMHVCTYARNARMHVCMYACLHVCMYACMHVCMYVCTHVCMYARMHVCMYACMHACMDGWMYVCMYSMDFMHIIYSIHMYSLWTPLSGLASPLELAPSVTDGGVCGAASLRRVTHSNIHINMNI